MGLEDSRYQELKAELARAVADSPSVEQYVASLPAEEVHGYAQQLRELFGECGGPLAVWADEVSAHRVIPLPVRSKALAEASQRGLFVAMAFYHAVVSRLIQEGRPVGE